MTGREKEIVRHLSEDDLNRLLTQTDSEKVSKRLTFIKRVYKGATLEDAADDVGMSQTTGSHWAALWNKGGLGLLAPSFGGGRPPKFTGEQQEHLLDLLKEGEPWKKQEIQHLINTESDVEFHPNYLPRLLDDIGLSYAIPRTERPDRPDNAAEILDERVSDAFDEDETDDPHNKRPEDGSDSEWTVDEDVWTDGGMTVGFFQYLASQTVGQFPAALHSYRAGDHPAADKNRHTSGRVLCTQR